MTTGRRLIEAAVAGHRDGRRAFVEHWPLLVQVCIDDPATRAALRELAPALDALDLPGARELALMLRTPHHEPFVALEPARRTGITGAITGVPDERALQVLLMDAIPPPRDKLGRPRRRVSAAVAATYRGEGPQQLDESVTAAWDIDERAPVGGERVLVLRPAAAPATWRAERLFDRLPASLYARRLTTDEVRDWLRRLG